MASAKTPHDPAFVLADWSASLGAFPALSKALTDDVTFAVDLARRFNAQVVEPLALDLDAAVSDDPLLLPHAFIDEANRWGLYSLWVPRIFGGGGHSFLSLNAFVEEVSSACVGLANVVGVHYLGVAALASTWNLGLFARIMADVVAGERSGTPCILSLAITEPGAGSDAEEVELAHRVVGGTQATPAPGGGYRVDGRKIFISNGHVASWHVVVTCEDKHRSADTAVVLALRTGADGFTLGAQEEKMGQKACVASELVFTDCYVPADQVAYAPRITATMRRTHREVTQTALDYVTSSTRAGVGAFAAGVAAGAYREAYRYASARDMPPADGEPRFVELQWVQTLLTDMARNALVSRLAYLESSFANTAFGLYALLGMPGFKHVERYVPRRLAARCAAPFLRWTTLTNLIRHLFLGRYPPGRQSLTSGLGSFAKVTCSDLAVANAHLAIDLLGADGLRHDHGVEKRLRDAKLLQIYEGTNQINRVNMFKNRIRTDDTVRVFVRAGA